MPTVPEPCRLIPRGPGERCGSSGGDGLWIRAASGVSLSTGTYVLSLRRKAHTRLLYQTS